MRAVLNAATCRILLLLAAISLAAFTAYAEDEEAIIGDAILGKAFYESTCKLCHTLTYDESSVGAPGLKGVLERHDALWLNSWLQGPEAFAKVDITAKDLLTSNPFGLIMPTLPAMQNDQKRADMIEFLKTLK